MQLNQTASANLNKYASALAKAYGINSVEKLFSITGPKETKLRQAILDAADFLKRITVADVDQITGQVIDVGALGLHTGRKAGGRFNKKANVAGNTFNLTETDSCCAITWDTLSVWANSGSAGEFMTLLNNSANIAFALDMLRVGFNGIEASATTDPDTYTNGEDVNIGWQKIIETESPEQICNIDVYLDYAGGGDYKTLDAMASDLINNYIPAQFRTHPGLTVLVGADLVAEESARIYDNADKPSEKKAAQQLPFSIAGRPAVVPPFFPGNRMVVTILTNLHIYTQKGTRHRKAEHVEDRKAFENTYLRWEGYAVGNHECYAGFNEAKVNIGPTPTPAAASEQE
ncbi:phage major capsid protein, P2 family [Photobacterium phosphoreum]|uniref:phage major capsid protein, P2 family n=1 Tax=Photobacterium phosphoreum TaxID=659 RepID=UPI001E5B26F5|nr:phage major capsid protein, P2 family [Photobacterium phosphoreum]MCD9511928.1 phage major capsid protein, P2 family [Photobacterium phosphoreum]